MLQLCSVNFSTKPKRCIDLNPKIAYFTGYAHFFLCTNNKTMAIPSLSASVLRSFFNNKNEIKQDSGKTFREGKKQELVEAIKLFKYRTDDAQQ